MLVLAASPASSFPFLDNPLVDAGFVRGRLTAVALCARYLWRLVCPITLSADYSYAQIPAASGTIGDWICWLVVVALAAAVFLSYRWNRTAFFFAGFAAVTFLPVSNLLFPIGAIMAERFLYLPAIAFCACLVLCCAAIPPSLRVAAPAIAGVLVAAYALRTWLRNPDWADDLHMAQALVQTSPNSFKVRKMLAFHLFRDCLLYTSTQQFDQSSDMYSANGYIAAAGTSFSAPMVAGAAALIKQLHPGYTVQQIKALLMNTANQTTPGDNWGDNVDALNVGAGRLDVGAATGSAVIAQAVTTNSTNPVSVSFGAVSKSPVSQQIQITNLGTASAALAVSVSAPMDVNGGGASGTAVAVSPTSVTVAAGASSTVTLTLSGTVPSADEYTGAVTITGTGVSIHVPYMFLVASGIVNDMQGIEYGQSIPWYEGGGFESLPSGDGGPIGIKLIDASGVPVVGAPVSFTVSPRNQATLRSVSGEPACSPSATTSATTCNTDAYGIAWVEAFGGSSVNDSPTITASAAGLSFQFGGLIINGPAVTSISEAAVGSKNIAAGSYISIYGTNLSDAIEVGNNTFLGGDAPTFLPYPMNLDGVTASFDIPGGQPGAYNGIPADRCV